MLKNHKKSNKLNKKIIINKNKKFNKLQSHYIQIKEKVDKNNGKKIYTNQDFKIVKKKYKNTHLYYKIMIICVI